MLSQDAGPSTIIAMDRQGPPQSALGRRLERACDMCRRKKVKCDGIRDSGNRCTNCIINTWDCTYVEMSFRRAPPKSYVEGLEKRVKQLTQLLSKISPETVQELDEEDGLGALTQAITTLQTSPSTPIHILESFYAKGRRANDVMPALLRHVTHLPTATTDSLEVFGEDLKEEEEEPDVVVENTALSSVLESMSLRENNLRSSRHSSGVQYIETAYKLKQEALHQKGISISEIPRPHIDDDFATFSNTVWTSSETSQAFHGKLIFPPHDLMFPLIDLYFKHMNVFYPFLHRPTFERSIVEGFHIKNDLFAATLLLVCAIGARFSDDPRVLLDRDDPRWESVSDMTDDQFSYSRGWQWAIQVPVIQRPPTEPPSLYELQFYVLWAEFLQGASAAQSCWPAIGFGIRIAQEVGVCRRKSHSLTLEDELWKRAFWVLVSLDRHFSSTLGRPCALHDEDFDVELPIECDDEYLDHPDPKQRFKQPPSKPSIISYFNSYLRLNQILAFLLRTVYTINRSKILFGYVGQGEQKMISELDSALNQWEESLPAHMVWDPNRQDETFFNQSATLHSAYQYVRILVHRPFIPSPHIKNQREFPSLTICTNAARSCANALDAQRQRVRFAPQPLQGMAFAAGVMLLMRIWSGKKAGLHTDVEREMIDVRKCLDSLKAAEVRHYAAGRQWDILNVLSNMEDISIKREPSDSPPYQSGVQHTEPPPPEQQQLAQMFDVEPGYNPTNAGYEPPDISVRIIYGDRVSPQRQPHRHSVAAAPTQPAMQFQGSTNFWYDTAQPYNNSQSASPQAPPPQMGDSPMSYIEPQGAANEYQQQQQQQQAYIQPQLKGEARQVDPRANGVQGYVPQHTSQKSNPYPTPAYSNDASQYAQSRPTIPENVVHSREGSGQYVPSASRGFVPPQPPQVAQQVPQQQPLQRQQGPANNYAVSGGRPSFSEPAVPQQGYNQYPTPPPSNNPSNHNSDYFPPGSTRQEGYATNSTGGYAQPANAIQRPAPVPLQNGYPQPPPAQPRSYPSQSQDGYNYSSGGSSSSEGYGHGRSGSNQASMGMMSNNHPSYGPAPTSSTTGTHTPHRYGASPYPTAPVRESVRSVQAQSTAAAPTATSGFAGNMPTQQTSYYGGAQPPAKQQPPLPHRQQQQPPLPHRQQQQYQPQQQHYTADGTSQYIPSEQMVYNHQNSSNPTLARSQQQPQVRPQPLQNMYAMWSAAPSGFRIDEWGQYLSDMTGTNMGHDPRYQPQPPAQNHAWQYQSTSG